MKKIVKIILLVIVFLNILFWIYKNPEKILEKKVQNQLIDTADKIDTELSE